MATEATGAATAPRGVWPMAMVVLAFLLAVATCGLFYVSKVPSPAVAAEAHHGKYTDRVPVGLGP